MVLFVHVAFGSHHLELMVAWLCTAQARYASAEVTYGWATRTMHNIKTPMCQTTGSLAIVHH